MLQRQPLLCHTLRLGRLPILKQQAQPLQARRQCLRCQTHAGLGMAQGLGHVALLAGLQGLLEGRRAWRWRMEVRSICQSASDCSCFTLSSLAARASASSKRPFSTSR
jgi:hypothetical protein